MHPFQLFVPCARITEKLLVKTPNPHKKVKVYLTHLETNRSVDHVMTRLMTTVLGMMHHPETLCYAVVVMNWLMTHTFVLIVIVACILSVAFLSRTRNAINKE